MSDMREICDLSDEEFAARNKELREGLMLKVKTRERLRDGVALLFEDSAQNRVELDEFVAFESKCCGSIQWSVREAAAGLKLEIHGVPPESEIFADLEATPRTESNPDKVSNPVQALPAGPGWKTGMGSTAGLAAVRDRSFSDALRPCPKSS